MPTAADVARRLSVKNPPFNRSKFQIAIERKRNAPGCGGVEPVADGGADGHSLFAFYLINALRENDREVIDLENLFHTRVWKPAAEVVIETPRVASLAPSTAKAIPADHATATIAILPLNIGYAGSNFKVGPLTLVNALVDAVGERKDIRVSHLRP